MEINAHNYREVLLQWLEGELSPTEVLQAEAFILVNETAAKEWQLLQKTKMKPEAKVFFPKKHLLMKEEEEVVIAPVFAAKVVEEESVIRTISGGFNYKKVALPASIAASLLLFFLFFNHRNPVQDNGSNSMAANENIQTRTKAEPGNIQPGLAANNTAGVESKTNIKTKNSNSEKQLAPAKTVNTISAHADKKEKTKAFSGDNSYVTQTGKNTVADKQELAQVKVELPVVANNLGNRNIVKLKEPLAKQNQELQNWEKAANDQNQQLAMGPDEEMERGILTKLTHFFTNNVKLKKRTEDDANYYAFSLETEKIKIVKTFKSQF